MTPKKPSNLASLQKRIQNLEGQEGAAVRRQNIMALLVVSQMLPQGAVKGGSAMALRYGSEARFTSDFDMARAGEQNLESFLEDFEEKLSLGWQGFSGRVVKAKPPQPPGVPPAYVMVPYKIKLDYEGKSWKTVTFELGHNELGAGETDEEKLSPQLSQLFTDLGFEAPQPVKVMKAEHQIAQKIHALTAQDSERAHDLIDLQLLVQHELIDYSLVKSLCYRTFQYRDEHSWPPQLEAVEGWEELYEAALHNMVLEDSNMLPLEDAVKWINDLINKIDAA